MPFRIIRADITALDCDAIVNAANHTLLGGGGVDGAIHRAAGPKLLEECRSLGGCRTGEAKITKGYGLKAKYVIHTVGPVWNGGNSGEEALLYSCYKNSLSLAQEKGLSSIAFPLISSGAYGYPKDEALRVARTAVKEFLLNNDDMDVILAVYDRSSFEISKSLESRIDEYIRENEIRTEPNRRPLREASYSLAVAEELFSPMEAECAVKDEKARSEKAKKKERTFAGSALFKPAAKKEESLKDLLEKLDDSFSESLFKIIDSKGLKDPEVYKKANVDRKLFSKIRSDPLYRPSKTTALALAIALELTLDETEALLRKAGYALSHSSKADVIIEFFIKNKNYDVFEINETLFKYDQNILGA